MLYVKKFGGSSVANKQRIFNVAQRCIEDYQKGHDVVVVLSAMGDTTDELLQKAADINPKATKRELDMLLTTGEQVSVSLMAMAFQALGVPSVSLNAFQVSMQSTSKYGNARFKRIDTDRINHELENRKIVVVTGFQGINKYDDYTTLGRGGSDTTAVALAAVLHADVCEIYTDVDGVYTADPRVVKNAKKLDEITYDEMLELASLGARVLHNRSVEMAKKYGGICQNIGRMIAVVLAVIYLSCGAFLYRLFFTEPEIIAMGVEIMRVIVVVVLLQIAQVIYMGCLRGAGDVIYTTIASTISVTIVRPIASYLLCYTAGLGIIGIWFGVCADQLVRFILTSLRFRSGKWTKIKI